MARFAGWLCVAAMVAAGAVAQEVTVNVRDASPREAARLLQDLTGAYVNAPPYDPQRRVTLKFDRAPLRRVLAELCRQAGWGLRRHQLGYGLGPHHAEDHRPRCAVGAYSVILNSVSASRDASIELRDGEAKRSDGLRLSVEADAETWEAMVAVWGPDPIARAVTDTGQVLAPQEHDGAAPYFQRSVRLELPPPDAKRLATLEGDLVLYADLDRAELEFDIGDVGKTKEASSLSVTFHEYDRAHSRAVFELVAPDSPPEQSEWPRPHTEVVLIGADGTRRGCLDRLGSSTKQDGVRRYRQRCEFRTPEGFEPAKLHYKVIIPRNPTRRLSYRFEDIPLPTWEGEE